MTGKDDFDGHTYRSYCLDCDWERYNTHPDDEWAQQKADKACRCHTLVYEDHEPAFEKVD